MLWIGLPLPRSNKWAAPWSSVAAHQGSPIRIVGMSLLFCLAACSSVASMSEEGSPGQFAWRHQRAVEDANIIIMQGMNRARTDSEWFAKQP
jgi:hypothetical protein